jgi:catechol 2,3-dioxygenase-like lactoylglutathione lyase family enzyme
VSDPGLTITGIDLVVKDMAASVAFYRRLGLTIESPGMLTISA